MIFREVEMDSSATSSVMKMRHEWNEILTGSLPLTEDERYFRCRDELMIQTFSLG